MESNLERDIQRKTQQIKKGIKELQDLLGRIFNHARKANNNKLIYIRRDTDKLNAVSNYLNNLELKDPREQKKESSFNKEMSSLYNETVKNLSKMQELLRKQEAAEKKDLHYKGRFFSDQKNLDNLRLAHSTIRQVGIGLSMSKQDWNEIEKK